MRLENYGAAPFEDVAPSEPSEFGEPAGIPGAASASASAEMQPQDPGKTLSDMAQQLPHWVNLSPANSPPAGAAAPSPVAQPPKLEPQDPSAEGERSADAAFIAQHQTWADQALRAAPREPDDLQARQAALASALDQARTRLSQVDTFHHGVSEGYLDYASEMEFVADTSEVQRLEDEMAGSFEPVTGDAVGQEPEAEHVQPPEPPPSDAPVQQPGNEPARDSEAERTPAPVASDMPVAAVAPPNGEAGTEAPVPRVDLGTGSDAVAAQAAPQDGPNPKGAETDTPPPSGAPQDSIADRNLAGQDIRVVGSYQPQGVLHVVNDAPALTAGDPNIPGDATGATPMRDDVGALVYRIDGGSRDGVIRQLVPAGVPTFPSATPPERLDTVVITGRRDPEADSSDTPEEASQGTPTAMVGVDMPPYDANSLATAAQSAATAARLANAARAGLVAELEFGPPPLKALAIGSLAAGAALAAWNAKHGGAQRDMLTPEEQREAGEPWVNIPPPPSPPLEGLMPPPQGDSLTTLPGTPIDVPKPPTVETYPDNQPLSIDDIIITRDIDVQRRFRGRVVGEGFSLDPAFKPEWYDAHHIIPLNEYPDLQDLRDKFADWGIDLNSLENGVALPNRTGEGTGTPHADTQNNRDYEKALADRFDDVTTREEALFVLGQVKQQLRDGTFIDAKNLKP